MSHATSALKIVQHISRRTLVVRRNSFRNELVTCRRDAAISRGIMAIISFGQKELPLDILLTPMVAVGVVKRWCSNRYIRSICDTYRTWT